MIKKEYKVIKNGYFGAKIKRLDPRTQRKR
jgi:hypothetical protein